MDFFVAPPAAQRRPPAGGRRGRTASGNPSSQPLNERYTFDTFVIGKSNELAAAAAPRRGRVAGQDLQPALHLRRHRPGQDPPDAGHRPRRVQRPARDPGPLRRRRAVHQRGHREHPQPDHAGVPPPLPHRRGPLPGGRRAFPRRQGDDPGGVLPHLQRALRGQQADRPHLRPAAQGDPGPRGPAGEPVRVGHGRRHRPARPGAPDRHPAEEAGAGPPGDDDPGRRAPLHRRARAVQRPRARGLHHQAAALRLAQAPGDLHRAGPRGAVRQDPAGRGRRQRRRGRARRSTRSRRSSRGAGA